MSVLLNSGENLAPWIRAEIEFDAPIKVGGRGQKVRRVQEWLNLHGFGLVVDGDFGEVTRKKVIEFQTDRQLRSTGIVDSKTFVNLVSPLLKVLSRKAASSSETFASMIV